MAKAKKKAAPKPSTALAVRAKKAAAPHVVIHDPNGLLPVAQSPVGQLGELATVGALGLAEIKLTEAEEKVLAAPVDPSLVMFKPKVKDGPPEIPYLPHIAYTRWFNKAFGRTGWSIVPTAAPKKVNNLVLVPYLLYIHGIPVAAATGEQEYYETNKQQTYGDVIESTVASALRRCAKRLGVGLEMWDKSWLSVHAIPPHLRGGARRSAPPPPVRQEDFIDADPRYDAPAPSSQLDSPYLTKPQLSRMNEIVTRAGRSAAEVSLWLKKKWGVKRAAELRQKDYKAVCAELEAPGDLRMPGDGQ